MGLALWRSQEYTTHWRPGLLRKPVFLMAFVLGYSLAAATIGEPDFGLLTRTEMAERAHELGADACFVEAPGSP